MPNRRVGFISLAVFSALAAIPRASVAYPPCACGEREYTQGPGGAWGRHCVEVGACSDASSDWVFGAIAVFVIAVVLFLALRRRSDPRGPTGRP